MTYQDFKDLARRTTSDKVFRNKAFIIAQNLKYDGYQRGLASIIYKIFDKMSKGGGVNNEFKQNEQLAEKLHKPIIKKLQKRRVYSSLEGTIWGADLADMQLISKFNKETTFLLCVIHVFSKYAQVAQLKDKQGITIVNAFQKILDNSTKLHSMRKRNKLWVDKGIEFCNSSFKKQLKDNDIETYSTLKMYSPHNEGKSVVAEKFIRTLKNKIYQHIKNVDSDKLDDTVNEYNNTYHKTIKMKPIEVKDNTYIDSIKEISDKDPKFKVSDHIRISKYKNSFGKGYTSSWSEDVFVIKEVKNTVLWTYIINNLNGEVIIGTFYEKELQKTNQQGFRIEK